MEMSLVNESLLNAWKSAIQNNTAIVQQMISSLSKEATWVLLLGATGSGKTTLLHSIAEKPLVVKEDENTRLHYLEPKQPWVERGQTISISHGIRSETFVPNVWADTRNNLVFFDAPGFMDTAREKRLVNAFCIDQILTAAKNVKILLVFDQYDFQLRANTTRDSLSTLMKMIPNEEQFRQCIGVVLTKIRPGANPIGLLKTLEHEEEFSRVIRFLSGESQKRVFSFPEPSQLGDYLSFEDKAALFTFLKHNPVANIQHTSTIDAETKVMVLGLGQSFNNDILRTTGKIVEGISGVVDHLQDEVGIGTWIQIVSQIANAAREGFKAFSDCCCTVFSGNNDTLKAMAQDFAKLVPWIEFMERISNPSEETRRILITQDTSPNSPFGVLIRHFDALLDKLNAKSKELAREKELAAIQAQLEEIKRRPPQIIHHYHDDGGDCCIQ